MEIDQIAERILADDPGPVVGFRLPRWARSAYFPPSKDRPRRGRGPHDHSTRVLELLRSCSGR